MQNVILFDIHIFCPFAYWVFSKPPPNQHPADSTEASKIHPWLVGQVYIETVLAYRTRRGFREAPVTSEYQVGGELLLRSGLVVW